MAAKKLKRFGMPVLAVIAVLLMSGCSKQPAETKNAALKKLPPDKVVESLFSGYQMADLTKAGELFSKSLPEKIVSQYLNDFSSKRTISEFKTKTISSDMNSAYVKVLYRYNKKDPKTGEIDYNKPVVETKQFELAKEDEYWKIRRFGEAKYDNEVEKIVFYDCLNAVMDATIAEEKYKQGNPTYTDRIAMLQELLPVNDSACEEMRIQDAGTKTYLIIAKTKNFVPCEITGNTDSHSPRRFEECPGK